jgi:hypothetical protein
MQATENELTIVSRPDRDDIRRTTAARLANGGERGIPIALECKDQHVRMGTAGAIGGEAQRGH